MQLKLRLGCQKVIEERSTCFGKTSREKKKHLLSKV